MKTIRTCVLLLLAAATLPCLAADAFVIRFQSFTGGGYWRDDVLFYNANETPAEVRLAGVSNSGPIEIENAPPMTIPPLSVMAMRDNWPVSDRWDPTEYVPLFVQHLDVPEGVVVESRNEFWVVFPELGGTAVVSKVSMPVYRELTPPNVPQVHLGTDIGRTRSRINVAVYNAGSEPAQATIEVRQPCIDPPADKRELVIAPNTVVQIGNLSIATPPRSEQCPYFGAPWGWVRTVTVKVDQPSLSFITNIAEQPCVTNGAAPCVGVSVPVNTRF